MYRHLTNARYASPRLDAPLYVIGVIFNPLRYQSRQNLYREFVKHASDAGAVVSIVELTFGERPHAIASDTGLPRYDGRNDHVEDFQAWQEVKAAPGKFPHSLIQLQTDEELWHKEAMINVAVSRLPQDWKYCAWVDADVTFISADWVHETLQQLQHYPVVQMFTHAFDVGPNGAPSEQFKSFAYSWMTSPSQLPMRSAAKGSGGLAPYYGGGDWHPGFCLPEGTLVEPGGRLAAVSRRWFEGDLVIIRTAAGNELAVTPNHPILTRNAGWQAAAALNVGDYVFSQSTANPVASKGDPKHIPASVEDITNAFIHSSAVSRTTVPMRAEHFHGDGGGSKVAVVWTNSFLRRIGEAEFVEQFPKRDLNRILFPDSFFGDGRLCPSHLDAASDFGGDNFSPFRSVSIPAEFMSVAATAQQSPALQPHGNDRNISSYLLANLRSRMSGFVERDRFSDFGIGIPSRKSTIDFDAASAQQTISRISWNADSPRCLLDALAGQIEADEIVYIGRRPFSGHVYNFSTERRYIIAGRIVTHNCWAYRREAWDTLGGMLDINIVGGGDYQMSFGLVGEIARSYPFTAHPNYIEELHNWQTNALRLKKNIGAVPGTIAHHWHGAKVQRGYFDRWKILQRANYDPRSDLRRDWQLLYQLSGDKPQLRDDLRVYFRARNEDSTTEGTA